MLVWDSVRFQGRNEIISYLFTMTAELFGNDNQPLTVTTKKTHPAELSVGFFAKCVAQNMFGFFSTTFSLIRNSGLLLSRKLDK